MHYYQFNIGDYAKATRHLSNTEDLAYRRLIDLYYDKEQPLIKDVSKLSRLINMRENHEEIKTVLEDFFTETEEGYQQSRIDSEIANYHAKADAARANGKKGGRPRKAKANPDETEGKAKKTQSVNLANPDETEGKAKKSESKANHKPLTNNQEPRTNNQEPRANKNTGHSKAKPKSAEEVQSYFTERGYGQYGIGQKFIDHYESIGWKRGKQPVKDWKATARTWMSKMQQSKVVHQNKQQSSYDALDEISKL